MKKLLVILGPTSSGKSDLAVTLAKQCDGEIISADSRQVYKHLDIATGKITEDEMEGIPHYLLDVAHPSETFSLIDFKKQTDAAIVDLLSRGKLPIIAGGTGFYIDAVVDNISLSSVKPNPKLREELERKETTELLKQLETLDPERAAVIDQHNRVRIIRSIEIATELGSVPKVTKERTYDVLKIGLSVPDELLHERIRLRTKKRFEQGMIEEAQKLHEQEHVSWERMESLGLEYKLLSQFLRNQITKEELQNRIETEDWQYAKRQMTWWKKDKEIQWFDISEERFEEKIQQKNQKWLET